MMLRVMCFVAVCTLTLQPAAAQQLFLSKSGSSTQSSMTQATLEETFAPPAAAESGSYATSRETMRETTTLSRRFGAVAASVFRTLAAQNTPTFGVPESSWMDANLRPPSDTSSDETIFRQAKKLYDDATTYRTDGYDLSIDPLSMKCRVKIRLGRLLASGSGS